jgi:hypothetical protein
MGARRPAAPFPHRRFSFNIWQGLAILGKKACLIVAAMPNPHGNSGLSGQELGSANASS